MTVLEKEINYRNRLIYKKTKAEITKLKKIKANLTRPFMNETIIHFGADSDMPTVITRKNVKSIANEKTTRKAA